MPGSEVGVGKHNSVVRPAPTLLSGHRKRERIGPDKRLPETVLRKRKVETEGRFLEKKRPVTTTFDELANAYLPDSRKNKRSWDQDIRSVKHLAAVFSGKRLVDISPADIGV
jgi:hypothetical protein